MHKYIYKHTHTRRDIPISEASSKWVLQRTWSMGDIEPNLAPLFWILTMLKKLDMKMANIVPAMVNTVPLFILSWSRLFITSSLKGPIFTRRRNATTPSANRTKNNNWIIFFKAFSFFSKTKQKWVFIKRKKKNQMPIKEMGILRKTLWLLRDGH